MKTANTATLKKKKKIERKYFLVVFVDIKEKQKQKSSVEKMLKTSVQEKKITTTKYAFMQQYQRIIDNNLTYQ